MVCLFLHAVVVYLKIEKETSWHLVRILYIEEGTCESQHVKGSVKFCVKFCQSTGPGKQRLAVPKYSKSNILLSLNVSFAKFVSWASLCQTHYNYDADTMLKLHFRHQCFTKSDLFLILNRWSTA